MQLPLPCKAQPGPINQYTCNTSNSCLKSNPTYTVRWKGCDFFFLPPGPFWNNQLSLLLINAFLCLTNKCLPPAGPLRPWEAGPALLLGNLYLDGAPMLGVACSCLDYDLGFKGFGFVCFLSLRAVFTRTLTVSSVGQRACISLLPLFLAQLEQQQRGGLWT